MDCLQQVTKHCPSIVHYMDCFQQVTKHCPSIVHYMDYLQHGTKHCPRIIHYMDCLQHVTKHCPSIVHYMDCLQHGTKHCPSILYYMDCLQHGTKHCPSIVHYMDCWLFCSTWQSTVSILFTTYVAVSPSKALSQYYSLHVLLYHLAKHCLSIVHYLDCCLLLQHLAKHCLNIIHSMCCCITWQSTVSILFTPCVAVSPSKALPQYCSLSGLLLVAAAPGKALSKAEGGRVGLLLPHQPRCHLHPDQAL